MPGVKLFLSIAIISAVVASGSTFLLMRIAGNNTTPVPTLIQQIQTFYTTQNATLFDPRTLRQELDHGAENIVLVDLRTKEEYAKEHMVSAINIPAYTDSRIEVQEESERIIQAFREIVLTKPTKEIVIYDYSSTNEAGRVVGALLAEHAIGVKRLSIGWNEWRYIKTLWSSESEWSSFDPEDYVTRGEEPGIPQKR